MSVEHAAARIGGPTGHNIAGLVDRTRRHSLAGGAGGSSSSYRGSGSSYLGDAAGGGYPYRTNDSSGNLGAPEC